MFMSERLERKVMIRCKQVKRLDRLWEQARHEGNAKAMTRVLKIQNDVRVQNAIAMEVALGVL